MMVILMMMMSMMIMMVILMMMLSMMIMMVIVMMMTQAVNSSLWQSVNPVQYLRPLNRLKHLF